MKAAFALTLALVLAVGTAEAQEGRVEPDRPSVTNSARTVPRGAFQIESGMEYARTSLGGAPVERRGSVQVTGRAGVLDRLELRLEAEPLVRLTGPEDETGVGDVVLGAKWKYLDGPEAAPWLSLGLLPFVKLPTAEEPIGSERADLGLLLLASLELPANVGFDMSAGVVAVGQSRPSGHLLQALVSGAFSLEIAERLLPFVEVVYAGPAEWDGLAGLSLGGGFVYRLTRRLALDAAVFTSLVGRAPDYAVRAGLTLRIGR